ncbi:MAG: hypothetical protein IPM92_12030 [Saprospiraceae bacterium]|nr:hypothetical protein [Saprospiraceae bacterium]
MKLVKLVLFALLLNATAFAQRITPVVISNGGNYLKTGSFGLEWTLGEFMVETLNGPTNKITQGFHQTNITIVTTNNPGISGLSVYPNPFSDYLIIENTRPSEIEFHLMNAEGRCIESKKLHPEFRNGKYNNKICTNE